ncbi:MAG: YccF domain-containing protein [Solirubrobacteraceae bacterium MAG38_C4-C5]|nr:YccF domain-containing protein [Candidatus Siliceabacter maunaloa]
MLRLVFNVIWLVLSGFWLFLGYALAGIVMCLLIVTIPFGLQAFKLAGFALWPFGRSVVFEPGRSGASVVGNVLWVVLAGWWLALLHIGSAIALAVTIIGLPLAWADLKLVPVALLPFGSEVVDGQAAPRDHGRAVSVA